MKRIKLGRFVLLTGIVLLSGFGAWGKAPAPGAGKTIAIVVAENEYAADRTMPAFGKTLEEEYGFHCEYLIGGSNEKDPRRHFIPGMEKLKKADLVILFVRRRALPEEQMRTLREYLEQGKPLIGIRTASHAFDAKFADPGSGAAGPKLPAGLAQWKTFDQDVFGCRYQNHYGVTPEGTRVEADPGKKAHPMLSGVPAAFKSEGSLYRLTSLAPTAQVLLWGKIAGQEAEPAVLTNTYRKGSRIVYNALGHPSDFEVPAFRRLLINTVFWAMGMDVPGK